MKLTYADTKLITDKGTEIVNLSIEYNSKITKFFKKMTTFPYDTYEWTGTPAEKYAEHVSFDKRQYVEFANVLKTFGNKIINIAESLDNCIKDCNDGDSYRG